MHEDKADWLLGLENHIEKLSLLVKKNLHRQQFLFESTTFQASSHLKLFQEAGSPHLLHCSRPDSAFYAIPRVLLPIADQLFPATAVIVSVPSYSLSSSEASTSSWLPEALKKIRYSPLTDALISKVNPDQIEKDVRHLTNEDGKASWSTRHSFTTGAMEAAKWIKCKFSNTSSHHVATCNDTVLQGSHC